MNIITYHGACLWSKVWHNVTSGGKLIPETPNRHCVPLSGHASPLPLRVNLTTYLTPPKQGSCCLYRRYLFVKIFNAWFDLSRVLMIITIWCLSPCVAKCYTTSVYCLYKLYTKAIWRNNLYYNFSSPLHQNFKYVIMNKTRKSVIIIKK